MPLTALGMTGAAIKAALCDTIDDHTIVPHTSRALDGWDAWVREHTCPRSRAVGNVNWPRPLRTFACSFPFQAGRAGFASPKSMGTLSLGALDQF